MAVDKKFYTVQKEFNGVNYTAQFNGLEAALKAMDGWYVDGSSNISTFKLAEYIFANVIVEPKGVKIDDFETMDDMNEVLLWAQDVMNGKFRNTAK